MSEGLGPFRDNEDGRHLDDFVGCKQRWTMDIVIILIVLLLLFGGGGGLYWGMGAGWGIGPIGLIIAVLVIAFLLNGYRGRRGPRLWYLATKAKLEVLSGGTFDKSYIKGMIRDHEEDIAMLKKEVASGKDPDAKALAVATLPMLRVHLKKIKSIANTAEVSVN
jgi:Domain of unknown function (DUF4142)